MLALALAWALTAPAVAPVRSEESPAPPAKEAPAPPPSGVERSSSTEGAPSGAAEKVGTAPAQPGADSSRVAEAGKPADSPSGDEPAPDAKSEQNGGAEGTEPKPEQEAGAKTEGKPEAKSEGKEEGKPEAKPDAKAEEKSGGPRAAEGSTAPEAKASPPDSAALAAKKAPPPKPPSATTRKTERRPVRRAKKKPSSKPPAAPPPPVSKAAGSNSPSDPARKFAAVPEKERVGHELERTERTMTRSRAKIGVGKNARAVELLASAGEFQRDARDAYKVSQYVRAERLTLAAREYSERAVRLVGPARDDPEYVGGALKRTDDALDRAKEVFRGSSGVRLERRFEDLRRRQKDAHKDLREGRVSDAYKETLAVRQSVLELLRAADDLPIPESAAERAVKGAERMLEHAGKEIRGSKSPEAERLLRVGASYLVKARASLARQNYRAAMLHAKVVEQHVERALDAARART